MSQKSIALIKKLNETAAELTEFARKEAVSQLLKNWEYAIVDGYSLETVARDLDALIDELTSFRNAVAKQVPETKLDPAGRVPAVIVSVKGGVASIEAASQTVNVHLVDLDREGEELEDDDIKSITAAEQISGTRDDVAGKLADLEGFLRRKFGADPAP